MSNYLMQRTKSLIENKGAFIDCRYANALAVLFKENCPSSCIWDYDIATFKETWELPVDELKGYLKSLKKLLPYQILIPYSNNGEPITAEFVINVIESLLEENEKNKEYLQYPDLVILDWI